LGSNLGKELPRHCGQARGALGLHGRQAGFEGGTVGGDPIQLGAEGGFGQDATDDEADRGLLLGGEPLERAAQEERVDLGHRGAPLTLGRQLGEEVIGVPEEPLDVGPDDRLERVGAGHRPGAAARERTSIPVPPVAAVPADRAATLRANVGAPATGAADDAAQQIDPAGVLGADPVACQGPLGGRPEIRRHERLDGGGDLLAVAPLRPPTVADLAAIDRVDDHVPDPTGRPETTGPSATDPSSIAGVVSRDAQGIELVGDLDAAPLAESQSTVDPADDVSRREIGP
jgi:hypothetical protein